MEDSLAQISLPEILDRAQGLQNAMRVIPQHSAVWNPRSQTLHQRQAWASTDPTNQVIKSNTTIGLDTAHLKIERKRAMLLTQRQTHRQSKQAGYVRTTHIGVPASFA